MLDCFEKNYLLERDFSVFAIAISLKTESDSEKLLKLLSTSGNVNSSRQRLLLNAVMQNVSLTIAF